MEVRILNKRGGVILANVHADENDYRMVKTMFRATADSEWKEIKMTPELKVNHTTFYKTINVSDFIFSKFFWQYIVHRLMNKNW